MRRASGRLPRWTDQPQPPALPRRLDRARVVPLADPSDGLVGRQSVEDGERGQRGAGAADPAVAGHLDPRPRPRAVQRLGERGEGVGAVRRDPEVRPAPPAGGPRRQRAAAEHDRPVGRGRRRAQPAAADPRPAGQLDQPGAVRPAHVPGGRVQAHWTRVRTGANPSRWYSPNAPVGFSVSTCSPAVSQPAAAPARSAATIAADATPRPRAGRRTPNCPRWACWTPVARVSASYT